MTSGIAGVLLSSALVAVGAVTWVLLIWLRRGRTLRARRAALSSSRTVSGSGFLLLPWFTPLAWGGAFLCPVPWHSPGVGILLVSSAVLGLVVATPASLSRRVTAQFAPGWAAAAIAHPEAPPPLPSNWWEVERSLARKLQAASDPVVLDGSLGRVVVERGDGDVGWVVTVPGRTWVPVGWWEADGFALTPLGKAATAATTEEAAKLVARTLFRLGYSAQELRRQPS